jgi:LmbE family N-acetylglucosaminyl deacetylase
MSAIVFLHAHPDDEAIFTGGTMVRLAEAGWRVVLVVATGGEQGVHRCPPGATLAAVRASETAEAARLLGAARVEFLGYADSGLAADPAVMACDAFACADVEEAAERCARICADEGAAALVTYDRGGIYPHPDHLQVHRVGARAAQLARVETMYEATVDYEYLHFVDTHLVEGASQSLAERSRVGLPTAEITTVVDVRDWLAIKRAAIAAHASQITPDQFGLPEVQFAATYGFEWFVRHGPRGPIEKAGLTQFPARRVSGPAQSSGRSGSAQP